MEDQVGGRMDTDPQQFPVLITQDANDRDVDPFSFQRVNNGFNLYIPIGEENESYDTNLKIVPKTLIIKGLQTEKKEEDSYLRYKRELLRAKLRAVRLDSSLQYDRDSNDMLNTDPIFATPVELVDDHRDYWQQQLTRIFQEWKREAYLLFLNRPSIVAISAYPDTLTSIKSMWKEEVAAPLEEFTEGFLKGRDFTLFPFTEEELSITLSNLLDSLAFPCPDSGLQRKALSEVINHYRYKKTLDWYQQWMKKNDPRLIDKQRTKLNTTLFPLFENFKEDSVHPLSFYTRPFCSLLRSLERLIVYNIGCMENQQLPILTDLGIQLVILYGERDTLTDFFTLYSKRDTSNSLSANFARLIAFPCSERISVLETTKAEISDLPETTDAEKAQKEADLQAYTEISKYYIDAFSDAPKINRDQQEVEVKRAIHFFHFVQPRDSFDYINTNESLLRKEIHDIQQEIAIGKYDPSVKIVRNKADVTPLSLTITVSYAPYYEYRWFKDGIRVSAVKSEYSENTLVVNRPQSGMYYCQVYGSDDGVFDTPGYFGQSGTAIVSIVTHCVRCGKLYDYYLDTQEFACTWSISPNFYDENIESIRQEMGLKKDDFTAQGILSKFIRQSAKDYPDLDYRLFWDDPILKHKVYTDEGGVQHKQQPYQTAFLDALYNSKREDLISSKFNLESIYQTFSLGYLLQVAQSYFKYKSIQGRQGLKGYGTMNGDCSETIENTGISKYSTRMQMEQNPIDHILDSIVEISEKMNDQMILNADTFATETFKIYSNKRLEFYGSRYELQEDQNAYKKNRIPKADTQYKLRDEDVYYNPGYVYRGRHSDHKKSPDLACFSICGEKIEYTPGSILIGSERLGQLRDELYRDFIELKKYWDSKALILNEKLCRFDEKIHFYNVILLQFPFF